MAQRTRGAKGARTTPPAEPVPQRRDRPAWVVAGAVIALLTAAAFLAAYLAVIFTD